MVAAAVTEVSCTRAARVTQRGRRFMAFSQLGLNRVSAARTTLELPDGKESTDGHQERGLHFVSVETGGPGGPGWGPHA